MTVRVLNLIILFLKYGRLDFINVLKSFTSPDCYIMILLKAKY